LNELGRELNDAKTELN